MSYIMRKPVFVMCEQQRRRSACASTQSNQHLCYALNFEEFDVAYWFRVVRACVRPPVRACVRSSRTVHARVLKFHIWISHGKIADIRCFYFLVRVISLSGVMSLWKSEWNLMHAISYEPCVLGFWHFIFGFLMENSWPVFFLVRVISLSEVMPFWKKIRMKSCEQDISKSI